MLAALCGLALMLFYNQYTIPPVKALTQLDYNTHVVLIGRDSESPVWKEIFSGAIRASEEYGVAIEYHSPESYDMNEELSFFEMSVYSDVDGIIINGAENDEFKKIAAEAKKEGIPVIFVNDEGYGNERLAYVGENNYQAGVMAIEEVLTVKNDEANIAILVGDDFHVQNKNRLSSMLSTIGDHPSLHLSTVEEVDNTCITLFSQIKELLLSNPDINTVVGTNVHHGDYICQVLVDMNLVGQINVIGYDATENTIRYIEKGIMSSTLDIDNEAIGYEAVKLIHEYQNGQFTDDVVYMPLNIVNRWNLQTVTVGVLEGDEQ